MKKLISLLLLICLTFTLFGCNENDSPDQSAPSKPDPRFYVPTEQKIYDVDGSLIFTRTFEFDENGFMSKVDTVYSGFRRENRRETYLIDNKFDSDTLKLTQKITVSVDGVDGNYTINYVWSFDPELNVIGASYISQGEEHYEEMSVELSRFVWLNSDGSFPSIDGGQYPAPTAELVRYDDSDIPNCLNIRYSEAVLSNNVYVNKIKADLASQYGEELVEYADIEKYVAYYTLWGAISRKQGDSATTELKYENGTIAEEIKWKNATPEEFISFHLLDWDWFGGGTLDFTAFRYIEQLYPPARPAL